MKRKLELDDIATDLWYCSRCQMCQAICTVHSVTRRQSHAPMPRVWLIDLARREILDFNDVTGVLYSGCILCRLCTEYCVSRQDIAKITITARADLVNLGKSLPKEVMEVIRNLESTKNPMGFSSQKFSVRHTFSHRDKKNADVVYFAGCVNDYVTQEISNALLKIFDAAELSYSVISNECCGLPAYELGFSEMFVKIARNIAEKIRTSGAKTVVSSCPGCVEALKLKYKELGIVLDVRVMHHTEFIEHLLNEKMLKIRKPFNRIATYHDPCHLGRYLGVYEAPRHVLTNIDGLKLKEPYKNRNKALCCGGGSVFRLINPEIALQIASKAFDELARTNAELLITACPTCKHSFKQIALKEKGLIRDVKDVAEIVSLVI